MNDPAHLRNIRQLYCVICGKIGPEAHHLLRVPGLPKGMGRKNGDQWAIPLCSRHHNGQRDSAHGRGDDVAWLASKGIDALDVARRLWRDRRDHARMTVVIVDAYENSHKRD